ncbi:MAG: DUF2946 family protein [Deltaproteobacteria bacterium]|nr:DUF2946 family protein [Deltaproteobacteria bacterium]
MDIAKKILVLGVIALFLQSGSLSAYRCKYFKESTAQTGEKQQFHPARHAHKNKAEYHTQHEPSSLPTGTKDGKSAEFDSCSYCNYTHGLTIPVVKSYQTASNQISLRLIFYESSPAINEVSFSDASPRAPPAYFS